MQTDVVGISNENYRKMLGKYWKKTVRDNLDIITLSLLEIKGDSHGYAIIEQIKKFYDVKFGASTVYPTLHNLEKAGLIKSEWKTPTKPTVHPQKRYSLTSEGRQNLYAGIKELKELVEKITFFPANIKWFNRAMIQNSTNSQHNLPHSSD